jgi:hypothetical protein
MRKSNTPFSGIFEQFTSHKILELVLKEEITVTTTYFGFSKSFAISSVHLQFNLRTSNIDCDFLQIASFRENLPREDRLHLVPSLQTDLLQ